MDARAMATGYDGEHIRLCTMPAPRIPVRSTFRNWPAARRGRRGLRSLAISATLLALAWVPLPLRASNRLVTGQVLSIGEVRQLIRTQTFVGDDAYAVLDSASLLELQQLFERELAKEGVSTRHGSEAMADAFVATAQMAFVARNWSSRTQAKAVAVGEAWLQSPDARRRAVVVAITERGVLYWDPQNARELNGGTLARATLTLCRI